MRTLRAEVHTIKQPATSPRNLQRGKNGDLLPGDKSGSAPDGLRESDVTPEGLSIKTSDPVAGARSEAEGKPHPPRNVRARGREMLERDNEGGKMKASPVDGYNRETKTVFQYHGCRYHGCPKCYPNREEVLAGGKTAEKAYEDTVNRTASLRKKG